MFDSRGVSGYNFACYSKDVQMAMEQTSYTVLARKWRPQRFAEVVGQEHVTRTLQQALAQQRVGQGYLFIGTRGVGKTTIARIFAKALNCVSGSGPVVEPCDQCEMCVAIREGTCLDVMEIDGASNRGIEEIRRLRDSVAIAPVSARYKIYIIDEVHMLTKEAFNALLKTLEEPPPHVKFFMATTEVHRVPATILSRVQKFELRRLRWGTLLEFLGRVAAAEGVQIEAGALATIARAGNGSVRDALSVFDQVLALAEDKVTEAQVTALLGWTDREIYAELHEAIVQQDVAGALRCVEKVIERGRDAEQFVLGLVQFLRNVLVVLTVERAEEVIEEPPEFFEVIKKAARNYSVEQALYAIDVLLELLPRMAGTEAKQTSLELAVLQVMYARRRVGIDEIFARLEALEGGGEGEGKIESRPREVREKSGLYGRGRGEGECTPQTSVRSEGELKEVGEKRGEGSEGAEREREKELGAETLVVRGVNEADVKNAWARVMRELEEKDPKLHALLQCVEVTFPDEKTVVLTACAGDEFTYTALKRKAHVTRIAEAVKKVTGQEVAIEVRQAREAPKRRAKTKEELIEEAKRTPIVKAALELFGGEITDVIEEE